MSESGVNEQPKLVGQSLPSQNGKEPQVQSSSGKSLLQLRVQAQGALLGLAPHNIRYEELVGEGIDPVILRQLYEEVGIRVSTPLPGSTGNQHAEPASPAAKTGQRSAFTEVGPAQSQEIEATTTRASTDNKEQTGPARPSSAFQSDTTKPMERKEVIARMLAARAAKAPGPSLSPQANMIQEASPLQPDSMSKSAGQKATLEASVKEKEIPVREKNKAQTELARQRIEQLKKQGLMRGQQKQPDPGDEPQPSAPTPSSSPNRHPLPERPPESEATPAHLPGLFMTKSDVNANPPPGHIYTPIQGLALDSTLHPRVAQRKRPRASDFDEFNDIPRRRFSQSADRGAPEDRLVIDISDDEEFYGGSENDHMDIEGTADQSQSFGNITSAAYLSSISTSLTPQIPRGNDQEHLRKKDMEIQAMHRKIAELEQRKKAKIAATTQSPRTLNSLALPETQAGTDFETSNVSAADEPSAEKDPNGDNVETPSETLYTAKSAFEPDGPNTTTFPGDLASMNATQLGIIRSKILRKQEIESGLPDLDAEIESSGARLSELKKDEEKLLLSIAKGKQGRQQLISEIEDLGLEINGLTLEELEAAQCKLASRKLSPPTHKGMFSTLHFQCFDPLVSK